MKFRECSERWVGGWREAAREQRDDERGKEVKTDEGNYLNILPLLPNKQEVPLTLHLRAPILLSELRGFLLVLLLLNRS